VQKTVYWLATARKEGEGPAKVLDRAVVLAGYTNAAVAKLTKDALLRNLDIADKLGCLDDAGLAEMRRGKAPTVMKGPYKGDQLSVDHIIPRAVLPELDNVITRVVVPAMADFLMAHVGLTNCFLLNGLSFLAVIVGLLMMRLPKFVPPAKPASKGRHMLEGFTYVAGHRRVRILLLLFGVVGIFGWSYSVLLPA